MADTWLMTLSESLWCTARSLRDGALPAAVVEKLKVLTPDTFGVALGSASLDSGRATRNLVRSCGSEGGTSVIGEPRRASPQAAALVNGVPAQSQD